MLVIKCEKKKSANAGRLFMYEEYMDFSDKSIYEVSELLVELLESGKLLDTKIYTIHSHVLNLVGMLIESKALSVDDVVVLTSEAYHTYNEEGCLDPKTWEYGWFSERCPEFNAKIFW